MKEFTDKYIRALRNGGPILLAILVIHDEQKDDFVKSTSKITANPDLALRAILKSTLDMNLDIYESIIDGSFLRKHILPVPDISIAESQATDSQTDTQDSQDTTVEEITDMELIDHSIHYTVRWSDGDETQVPLENLFRDGQYTCLGKIAEFHQRNPHIPPSRGRKDLDIQLFPATDEKELGIYCHLFLDVTDVTSMLCTPSTKVVMRILELMELYCEEIPQGSPRYSAHQSFIESIDFPDDKWGFSDPRFECKKRHLPSKKREEQVKKFLALKIAECHTIPKNEWDKSFPLPISECGLTDSFASREKAHASHSSTTALLAFWECLSLAEFGDRYRWVYQPIVLVRDAADFAIMESFFHRALQTYFHLGGVNIHPAGISAIAMWKFTLKDEVKAMDKVDFEKLDDNLERAIHQLINMKYTASEKDRARVDQELQRVGEELRNGTIKYYEGFFKLLNEMATTIQFHEEMLEEDQKVQGAHLCLDTMDELRADMEKLRSSGVGDNQ